MRKNFPLYLTLVVALLSGCVVGRVVQETYDAKLNCVYEGKVDRVEDSPNGKKIYFENGHTYVVRSAQADVVSGSIARIFDRDGHGYTAEAVHPTAIPDYTGEIVSIETRDTTTFIRFKGAASYVVDGHPDITVGQTVTITARENIYYVKK